MTMPCNLTNAVNEFLPDYPIDEDKLVREYYAWDQLATDFMCANGLGHLSLWDLLGRDPARAFIMARTDCGIRLSDDWNQGKEYRCCEMLDRAAKVCGVFI